MGKTDTTSKTQLEQLRRLDLSIARVRRDLIETADRAANELLRLKRALHVSETQGALVSGGFNGLGNLQSLGARVDNLCGMLAAYLQARAILLYTDDRWLLGDDKDKLWDAKQESHDDQNAS